MGRTETDNAGNPVGTAGAVGPRRRGRGWREWTDAGVVVVKDIDATVGRVLVATDAQITGAEITGRVIDGVTGGWGSDCLANPGAVLAVGSHDNPFFTQGMPTFFPYATL